MSTLRKHDIGYVEMIRKDKGYYRLTECGKIIAKNIWAIQNKQKIPNRNLDKTLFKHQNLISDDDDNNKNKEKEKKFQCEYCGKKYVHQSFYKKHISEKHQNNKKQIQIQQNTNNTQNNHNTNINVINNKKLRKCYA